MLTIKWLIGLVCLFVPTSTEGSQDGAHADQMTCGTCQDLTIGHAT
jgi:hypothetical protein